MTQSHWQVQEAKQKFSELLRRAQSDGTQFVTRHGAEVAVVIDIQEYRRLSGHGADFKDHLTGGPKADLEITRTSDPLREVDLTDHR